jgi:hypothetical protein
MGKAPSKKKPRGALSASAGWDLGRNDHTDEEEQEAPRGAYKQYIRYLPDFLCVER